MGAEGIPVQSGTVLIMDADTAFYKAFAESWKAQWEAAIAAQAVVMANLEARERELEELRRQVPPSATSVNPWSYQGYFAGVRECEIRIRDGERWDVTLKDLTADQKDAVMAALQRRQWTNWDDVPDEVVVRADEDQVVPTYYCRRRTGTRYVMDGGSGHRIDWEIDGVGAPEGPFTEVDWANKPGE